MFPLVYFVRHGQTGWNAEFRLQGQADTDLTDFGRGQADRNGHLLSELIVDPADFDFVASPLRRTRETMQRIRTAMRLPANDFRTDAILKEIHFGDWQGSTFAELEAKAPGSTEARQLDKWGFVPPGDGAESYEMLLARIRPWFESIRQPTVCVTHGGVIRTLFRLIEDMPESDAAALDIAQDRVLRLENDRLEWL